MLKVTARAKINWSLNILGTLENGYHQMDMLMSNVSLADELEFVTNDTLALTVSGLPALAADENLVIKAAKALQTYTGYTGGADIRLCKHIPHGAGMGGGSADAAAALLALNRLWETHLPMDALHTIAKDLGADVPFFLVGGLARIGGYGEIVQPLPQLAEIPLVILQPCKPQPTRQVFALYDALTSVARPRTEAALEALQKFDLSAFAAATGNVLQQALEPQTPQITEALAALDACGAEVSMMTGSGSAVFGAFTHAAMAAQAQRTLRKRWKRCWAAHTHSQSITIEEV